MRVYHFRRYLPSNVIFVGSVTYIRFKFEEELAKTAVAIEDDRHIGHTYRQTNTQVILIILYLSNAMDCIGQAITVRIGNFYLGLAISL